MNKELRQFLRISDFRESPWCCEEGISRNLPNLIHEQTKESLFKKYREGLGKAHKRCLIEDPLATAVVIEMMRKLHIDNQDMFFKFYDALRDEDGKPNPLIFKAYCDLLSYGGEEFLAKYLEYKGQTGFTNVLIKNIKKYDDYFDNMLGNSISLYNEISRRKPDLLVCKNGNNLFTLKFWDLFSELKEIKFEIDNDVALVYDDICERFIRTEDGITFRFPKTRNELFKIGQELHNDVQSCLPRIINHNCLIACMVENDTYVGCIELDAKGEYILQISGITNERLEGRYADAARKWIQNTNLNTSKCRNL